MIYKDRSKLMQSSSPISTYGNDSKKTSDLNITGSPLEDDKSIHEIMSQSITQKKFGHVVPWNDNEETYAPIDIATAREILNNIINQKFPKGTKGWIFILCNDESPHSNKQNFILSSYINEDLFSRGIACYHGIVKHEDKSMTHLWNRHKAAARGINGTFDIQIENIFELKQDINLKFIHTTANETTNLISIDNFNEVILYQQIQIENGSDICKELWEQIFLLHAIHSDIVRYKNNSGDGTLVEPTYSYGSMTYERLQERVNHILTDVVTINEDSSEDKQLESVITRVSQRPLVEVTDQLWELLKFASSYTDLRRIITFVFQISSKSCIVNVPMNNNRMGELIRELTHQRLAIPHLTSTEPMELLLEIGLEKVMKDYEYIFNESKICLLSSINIGEGKISDNLKSVADNRFSVRKSLAASADKIQTGVNRKTLLHGVSNSPENFDEIRNSRFNERESLKSISKLAQIHLSVEHLLLIQSHLNLDHDYATVARKLLESPLMSYDELLKRKYSKFEIVINDKNVIHLVSNLIPNAQKINMRSENKFKVVESAFYYNIEQIVPFLVRKENEGDEPVEKKNNSFHFVSHTNITSKF